MPKKPTNKLEKPSFEIAPTTLRLLLYLFTVSSSGLLFFSSPEMSSPIMLSLSADKETVSSSDLELCLTYDLDIRT